jgi:hypothetical protein
MRQSRVQQPARRRLLLFSSQPHSHPYAHSEFVANLKSQAPEIKVNFSIQASFIVKIVGDEVTSL